MWWKSQMSSFLPAEEHLDMFDSDSDSSGDLGHSDSDAELVEVS
jgi:hypothetical protein